MQYSFDTTHKSTPITPKQAHYISWQVFAHPDIANAIQDVRQEQKGRIVNATQLQFERWLHSHMTQHDAATVIEAFIQDDIHTAKMILKKSGYPFLQQQRLL